MSEEDAFQAHLDAHPGDHRAREVFADWLQDRDDPRAEGYRALGRLRRVPYQFGGSYEHWYWSAGTRDARPERFLPRPWFDRLAGEKYDSGFGRWDWPWSAVVVVTRRQAEDAAAVAFAALTTKQKARILGRARRAA